MYTYAQQMSIQRDQSEGMQHVLCDNIQTNNSLQTIIHPLGVTTSLLLLSCAQPFGLNEGHSVCPHVCV